MWGLASCAHTILTQMTYTVAAKLPSSNRFQQIWLDTVDSLDTEIEHLSLQVEYSDDALLMTQYHQTLVS